MRHAQSLEFSVFARWQPITYSLLHTIRSAALPRTSQMPSMKTTRWISSHTGSMGQMDQKRDVLRLKVLPSMESPDWDDLPSSHFTKAASGLAVLSFFVTDEAPHEPQHHLCVPAFAVPFFIIFAPQTLHFGLDIRLPLPKANFLSKKLA